MNNEAHIPVLLEETISGLNIKPSGTYVDLTLGRAGHSSVILSKLDEDGLLIGVDQDKEAIEESNKRLSKIASNYKLVKSNFVNFEDILSSLHIDKVDGVLMDLGVSSPQFDESDRGFSYRYDAPLDMRMDVDQKLTAKEVVNTYSEAELRKILDNGSYIKNVSENIKKFDRMWAKMK